MDDTKQQVADRLKQANNILVTVKTDPSIDLLAACLGLSLVLDKIGKHATAVFSGEVPSVMEFLKPDETLEKTPNSLRDFIISLDKSKADKLRYKVEDKVVRIFITPFKAGLTQDDLEFSQGDFNIDLLIALGVREQAELDAAVTAHGRILHDAAVISINTEPNGNLGTLNWQGTNVSSVSEMIASLAKALDPNVYDEQIATALLTGIVAETARFSNDKTSPQTMAVAGELMAAGANQQLVATELQATTVVGAPGSVKADIKPSDDNGTLEIEHTEPPTPPEPSAPEPEAAAPTEAVPESPKEPTPAIVPNSRTILPMPGPDKAGDHPVSDVGSSFTPEFGDEDHKSSGSAYLIDKPNDVKVDAGGVTAPKPLMTDLPPVAPVAPTITPPADGTTMAAPSSPPMLEPLAPGSAPAVPTADDQQAQTLEDIEASVKGTTPAESAAAPTHLEDARQQVLDALKQGPQPLEPLASLNAQPLGAPLAHDEPSATPATDAVAPSSAPTQPAAIHVDDDGNLTTVPLGSPKHDAAPNAPPAMDMPLPPLPPLGGVPQVPNAPIPNASTVPPPVPPPMMPPPFGP